MGARYRDLGSQLFSDEGAVYSFELIGGSWVETDEITVASSHELGASIALGGDRAILGAEYDDIAGVGLGAAYVAERQADRQWSIVGVLTSPSADRLDRSVALAGERAVVGSLWDSDDSGQETGGVHIYDRDGQGVWSEVAVLYPPDAAASDAIGSSVAFEGDRVVSGDQLYSPGADHTLFQGGILVFERESDASWSAVAHLTEPDPVEQAEMGRSVGIVGNLVLATSSDWDTNQGRLSVFYRQPDGRWPIIARYVFSGSSALGIGGHTADVQLAHSATTVAVGVPLHSRPDGLRTGGVLFFDLSPLPVR